MKGKAIWPMHSASKYSIEKEFKKDFFFLSTQKPKHSFHYFHIFKMNPKNLF